MKISKEDYLEELTKKAVEKANKDFPNEPPMEWPESKPKKPDLRIVSGK